MEIKLITTNVTTSGGGRVGFRLLGNVEIAKPKPTIFGTTIDPNQTVGFNFNNVETTVNSNDEGYFELYRDSDEPITQFGKGTNYGRLKTLNVSGLDTSQVTNMGAMFWSCSGLTSLDASKWNTSQVTGMGGMFTGCMGLTSLDLSNWNTSQVTDMGSMFSDCSGLTSLDLSNWDTSKVTFMYGIFSHCISLRTIKINNETSAYKLIDQIKKDLYKTATWDSTTKEITIPV